MKRLREVKHDHLGSKEGRCGLRLGDRMEGNRAVDGGSAVAGSPSTSARAGRSVSRGGQGRVRRAQGGPRETVITGRILKYLNGLLGCYARKVPGSVFSSGWPDIVGCYAGRAFLIEVKRPGGKPTPLQDAEMKKWAAVKARVLVTYSVDDVAQFMAGYHEGGK